MGKKKMTPIFPDNDGSLDNDIIVLQENAISNSFFSKEDIPPKDEGMVERIIKEEIEDEPAAAEPESIPAEPEKDEEEKKKEKHKENLKKEIGMAFSKEKNPRLVGQYESIELKDAPFIIGKKGDYKLNERYVSHRHCLITEKDGRYFIEDLKSTNGTFVDGKEANEKTEILNGQTVKIADREYIVYL